MKKSIKYFLAILSLITTFAACKKDENKVVFEGGDKPLLSASSATALVLNIANSASQAIAFSWTNPNYKFNTGISSQNVTYILQIDTTGANFTNPAIQEISIANNLNTSLTVKELNTVLTKLNLLEKIAHNVEFRIKSTLINNSVPLFSNVIKVVITPYLDVAVPLPPSGDLYITGNAMASDWTNNPPANQKFSKLSNTEYTITVPFAGGKFYKFLSILNQWQPQYGGNAAAGGTLGFNMGLPGQSDPDAIPTPGDPGNYKITVNFKTGKYTVVKI